VEELRLKAFMTRSLTGIESLAIETIPPAGAPGPGQIRVAMRAASLNYRDLLVLSGELRSITLPELIPCSDGAGEVTEVGSNVWRVKVGDRIALTFSPHWIGGPWQPLPGSAGRGGAVQGVMQRELVVNQDEAVVLPPHLSFEEGATLPCAAVTAWHSLCVARPLLPGMTVLLEGGGGVSLFALQLAKLFGARVIMVSSSAERCARLKSLGADEVIDYKAEPEWNVAVRKLTAGNGVDLTVEVGGADTVQRAMAATRMGGRIALVGRLSGRPNASMVAASGLEMSPVMVGSRQDFEAMNRALAFHKVKPVIARSYPFEQLPDALRYLQSGRHMGKIVVGFD
jgi:NADPH:quinone reductase-like Zn-dependent oxidoreductase